MYLKIFQFFGLHNGMFKSSGAYNSILKDNEDLCDYEPGQFAGTLKQLICLCHRYLIAPNTNTIFCNLYSFP